MSDEIKMLYDLVKEVDRKQDMQTEQLTAINMTLAEQHQSLRDHMRRTEIAEQRLEIHTLDIQKLQEPSIVRKYVWNVIKGVFVLLGGIYTIDQVIRAFSRYVS